MAKRSTAGLIKYVKFLMEAGAMERPMWLEAVERVPPLATPKHGKRPPKIAFPEDELIRRYDARNPEAVLEPVDLGSFDPPTSKRFALRQLELMEQQGMTQREAYQKVKSEFSAAAASDRLAGWQPGKHDTIIEQIQAEEEAHLKQALQTYITNHGHRPLSQMMNNKQRNFQQQRLGPDGKPLRKMAPPAAKIVSRSAPEGSQGDSSSSSTPAAPAASVEPNA